jgi:hypothetical protein
MSDANKSHAEYVAKREALNKRLHDFMIEAWQRREMQRGTKAIMYDAAGRPIASVNTPLPPPRRRRAGPELDFG